jgi:integrase
LALHTGLRKGELWGLRWTDLDFDTRRLTVARSYGSTPKSGKARHLRLPDAVVPILSAWAQECPPSPEGLVFPIGVRNQRGGSKEAMLGLPELLAEAGCRSLLRPWHALRHTFASHFIMQGGNLLSLQKILGHSDIRMTLIYAHLQPNFLGEEMNRLKYG